MAQMTYLTTISAFCDVRDTPLAYSEGIKLPEP